MSLEKGLESIFEQRCIEVFKKLKITYFNPIKTDRLDVEITLGLSKKELMFTLEHGGDIPGNGWHLWWSGSLSILKSLMEEFDLTSLDVHNMAYDVALKYLNIKELTVK